MKQKFNMYLFGLYELIIAFVAFYTGIKMISDPIGELGVFAHEFPIDWSTKLQIDSWSIPGIFAILLFGIGNVLVFIYCITKNQRLCGILGIIMGSILFVGIIIQMLWLEIILFSIQCLLASIIQILWGIVLLKNHKTNALISNQ
ncbi:hypothetical protein SH1V18_13370 [Vallitalea longa]|uniref:Uncharacterized protein n=1 Tax=Vallitalea longa TaxID=2936439 RepID=A0A9W5Y8M6_9FIRM|nr:hypothetical protein [Vallitalea longa]GKX28857.1 hypothetical protein SH1V18_13370 [Vallitalea longa]